MSLSDTRDTPTDKRPRSPSIHPSTRWADTPQLAQSRLTEIAVSPGMARERSAAAVALSKAHTARQTNAGSRPATPSHNTPHHTHALTER
mmetsp:Transcript_6433/g.18562  ORF Transcript_6433/g.18562 Transcript_6433/m.18562 type:complete len:90 (-) Transcript_6433:1386-1655(-)